MNISVRIEIFKEEDAYVALSREINISSFGDTIEDAKISFREAFDAFIQTCTEMGTLQEVLEEAGFIRQNDVWEQRQPVFEENLAVAI